MITNDRQYKIVKSQVDDFKNALEGLSFTLPANVHPKLVEAHRNAIYSKLNELLDEVNEYEDLKDGKIIISEIDNIDQLPLALIRSRIANQLTQSELAERLGMKMQQIQRYESEKYSSASLKTLIRIADQLKLKLNADVQLKSTEAPEILDIKNYPFKQMFQRNWFGTFLGSYNDAVKQSPKLLAELFSAAGINNFKYSLTKKSIRTGSNLNEFALKAWYARVLLQAKNKEPDNVFHKDVINSSWLKSLAEISIEEDAPLKVAKYLDQSGIRFIIEPVLEGTFLDGAALLLDDLSPVIAMTLRHDRLDNFWFVLFHEIAHIVLHLNENLNAIFDDLDVKIDGIEHEADVYALNALIPDELWRKSLVRFNPSYETIINQSEMMNIHPALLAGRIRRETGKYYLFTDLIGQGEVRKHFEK
ncbi:ImmA/IrrE family metallo-endopeptidase [Flavobacterium zepuense]|uniref:ImmA/IrrE family metallo-endopeptidase n=1 Tax=Flavobacterium zepuense TaxID=2593302 RepID=A0A552V680_9FLAO|nr:XRE family transcriptional regulator [Flavobacterium zepuense]TRW25958.1 ImmA/IrrE family metallo-endopeptidase [Flavobacterium zepuense]